MSQKNQLVAIQYDDYSIVTGQDFRETITLKDPNNLIAGVAQPLDLTGYTIQMDIRKTNSKNSDLLVSLTDTNGGVTGPAGGVLDATGIVTFFIDNLVTKDTTDANSIGNNVGRCAFYDVFILPPAVGADNMQIMHGQIPITESTSNV